MAGRGSFIESFPLFGYDLDDYDELFAEKLELLLRLRDAERVTLAGRHRPPLIDGRGVYPRPVQEPLPVWVAVGGNAAVGGARRALGLPMALAIIGGEPARFAPFVDALPRAARRGRARPGACRWRSTPRVRRRHLAGRRPTSFPAIRADDEADRPRARLGADDPARSSTPLPGCTAPSSSAARSEVAEKILFQHEIFGHQRFLLQLSVGAMPHREVLRAIELLGTAVAPIVREEVARRASASA